MGRREKSLTADKPHLTVLPGGRSADDVLKEASRLFAEYVTQRLDEVDEPERLAGVAAQLRLLAG